MIRPVPERQTAQPVVRLSTQPVIQGPIVPAPPTSDEVWRISYEAKVAQLARETWRTSTLIRAMWDAGHRATNGHAGCGECRALAEVGTIDPPSPSVPDTGPKRILRPDTGDNRSLPCVSCGTRTPDASYCCGMPYCDNCRVGHA